MIKTFQIFFLLISLLVVIIHTNPPQNSIGYIINKQQNSYIHSNLPFESNVYQDENILDLIQHNIGLLESIPKEQQSINLIHKMGNNLLLNPIFLNYLFVIQTNDLSLVHSQMNIKGYPIKANICDDQSDMDQCLISRIFDEKTNISLINKINKNFGNNSQYAYLYSSSANALYPFKNHLLSSDFQSNQENIMILDENTQKQYPLDQNLEQCANKILKSKFQISLKKIQIKNLINQEEIPFHQENKQLLAEFIKDICSVVELSQMIRKDTEPNIYTFYIKSLGKLQEILNERQKKMIIDIWNIAYYQFTQNIKKQFDSNQISGQIIFTTQLDHLEDKYRSLQSLSQHRLLQKSVNTATLTNHKDERNHQIYVWLPVILALILFFSVSALFNMEFTKDTLLYAKFLTVDNARG